MPYRISRCSLQVRSEFNNNFDKVLGYKKINGLQNTVGYPMTTRLPLPVAIATLRMLTGQDYLRSHLHRI